MGMFSAIGNFFKGLFNKVGATITKMWKLAEPFLQEVLSQTAQSVWASLQSLAVEAVQYVGTQGLPTDQAKQDAFVAYMTEKAKDQVTVLKASEINLLRETAVAIYKKATTAS